ncbi:MAG: hypothetical protein RLZZ618_981 [Pseudomonadota bacterium]
MTHSSLHHEAASFFDDFVAAFEKFDGALIARRYVAPYMAVHVDRPTGLFVEHDDIGRYFQDIVDNYHQQGCRSCRYMDLEAAALGRDGMVATVSWDLLREDGSVLSHWRESYTLHRAGGKWRIFASVDHAA